MSTSTATSAKAAFGEAARPLALVVFIIALAGSTLQRVQMDREAGESRQLRPIVYVNSGDTLRRLSFGYEGLLADIYWTGAVQYFGRERLARRARFGLMGPLLRVTTTLDPQLVVAYRFGAIFLAEKPPAGAGRPEEALALIRRGIVANPAYWRLWQDLGFIYCWDLGDYAQAARVFDAGSRRPGAEMWMKTLAATVAAQGGERQTSRLLWAEVYRHADNESIRRSALEHLAALQAAEDMAKLDRALTEFESRAGRPAASLEELVGAGLLARKPLDPSGAPYVINKDGKAALGPSSSIDLGLAAGGR
jgi:tetratricopeptide (TPR) repeat protein